MKLAYLRNGSDNFRTSGASQIEVKVDAADVFQYGVGVTVGKTVITYRPAGAASSRTDAGTASVNINYKSTNNAINNGEILKFKFPSL